ncbi:unnamed protein product [Amoebophrya sp. A25]|nr:unnamed protein product [Amoebophrya sp. A25]|eukprot:GSA25T00003697001.1
MKKSNSSLLKTANSTGTMKTAKTSAMRMIAKSVVQRGVSKTAMKSSCMKTTQEIKRGEHHRMKTKSSTTSTKKQVVSTRSTTTKANTGMKATPKRAASSSSTTKQSKASSSSSPISAPVDCGWAGFYAQADSAAYREYHASEWGRPCNALQDLRGYDQFLFEMLVLELNQAGLSWATILNKRSAYRKAFCGFHIEKVSKFTEADVLRLLEQKPGITPASTIVRNRKKIEAAIANASVVLRLQEQHGSFCAYLWKMLSYCSRVPMLDVGNKSCSLPRTTSCSSPKTTLSLQPIIGHCRSLKDIPSTTPLSDCLAKELKKEGMKFLGSAVVYAFLQGTGFVNDHLVTCPVYKELVATSAAR